MVFSKKLIQPLSSAGHPPSLFCTMLLRSHGDTNLHRPTAARKRDTQSLLAVGMLKEQMG